MYDTASVPCIGSGARSFPRNLQRARSTKFPAQLATSAEHEVPRATCNEHEVRSSPRHLQQARSAKFPAQDCERFGLSISIDVRFYRVRRRSNAKRPLERAVRVKRLERKRNCGGAGGQSPQRPSIFIFEPSVPYPSMRRATSSPIFFVPASFPAAFTAAISPAMSPVRQPSSSTLSTAVSIARASVSA